MNQQLRQKYLYLQSCVLFLSMKKKHPKYTYKVAFSMNDITFSEGDELQIRNVQSM